MFGQKGRRDKKRCDIDYRLGPPTVVVVVVVVEVIYWVHLSNSTPTK